MDIYRSYFYYTEKKDDSEVEAAIRDAAEFGDGFWKIFQRLRREGRLWNHKKVYRVYKQMHYEKRSKLKKRLPARVKRPLVIPSEPNTTWSIDFVSDKLQSGRTFRVLNIIDDCDRVAVGQEVSISMPAERVIKLLEKVIWLQGKPKNIRCDNGPEFISKVFQEWCKGNDITVSLNALMAVTEKVSKEVENVLNGKSTKNPQQSQQPVSGTSQVQKKPVVTDYGENIPRQDGLDYIDEYGINHGGGILIDTVLWAPVNCGYHETDYPYGKLYQWGRKHGQGYGAPFEREEYNLKPDKTTAVIVPAPVTPQEALKHPDNFYARSEYSSFNWTKNDTKLWNSSTDDGYIFKNKDYDPCPEGWRLPDLHDFYCLAQNFSEEVVHPETGQKGRWFSGSQPYGTDVPRVFLPLA